MIPTIPTSAVRYGFTIEGLGTHSSRTMMLEELQLLLAACPPSADHDTYRTAAIEENVLLKRTQSTRAKSFRHLRELYALSPDVLLFAALRDLWDEIPEAQPMLALLCALARDPSLRSTAGLVLALPPGSPVTAEMLADAAAQAYPGLTKGTTLATTGRNTGSTWTQSGHLAGRTDKRRVQAESHATSVTYALLLGHLCGMRGERLFHTMWAQALDHPVAILQEQAALASKQGWLEYRHTGAVTEITFKHLLRDRTARTARRSSDESRGPCTELPSFRCPALASASGHEKV